MSKKGRRPADGGALSLVQAPFDEELPLKRRTELALELSELVTRIVTHVICHIIVDYDELLSDERMSIAHAFLQRVTSTHMCNHKLTAEGLVYQYNGQAFQLQEEYKTTTLTRSVYEHLAMFYFLYEHPKNAEERDIVWKYWQMTSWKNKLDNSATAEAGLVEEQRQAMWETERLRKEILATPTGSKCRSKLDALTKADAQPGNGCIEFFLHGGKQDVRRVSYSQAWKYLFHNKSLTLLYRYLSMHCHPVYEGLLQYQSQSEQGEDATPLHLSSCFLACMCRLFLKQVQGGDAIVKTAFSEHEQQVFMAMARLPE